MGFFGPANFTFRMLAGACELDFSHVGGLPWPGSIYVHALTPVYVVEIFENEQAYMQIIS